MYLLVIILQNCLHILLLFFSNYLIINNQFLKQKPSKNNGTYTFKCTTIDKPPAYPASKMHLLKHFDDDDGDLPVSSLTFCCWWLSLARFAPCLVSKCGGKLFSSGIATASLQRGHTGLSLLSTNTYLCISHHSLNFHPFRFSFLEHYACCYYCY